MGLPLQLSPEEVSMAAAAGEQQGPKHPAQQDSYRVTWRAQEVLGFLVPACALAQVAGSTLRRGAGASALCADMEFAAVSACNVYW
jgi:hypothetical protein